MKNTSFLEKKYFEVGSSGATCINLAKKTTVMRNNGAKGNPHLTSAI